MSYDSCVILPDHFDPSTVTVAMIEEIHAVNRESIAAGEWRELVFFPAPELGSRAGSTDPL